MPEVGGKRLYLFNFWSGEETSREIIDVEVAANPLNIGTDRVRARASDEGMFV